MKIAVIGTGNVGSVLGSRWAKSGYQVVFGSRDPQSEKVGELLDGAGPNARAATASEAAVQSDVVVLATPWSATEEVVKSTDGLAGKILVDCTNPLEPDLSGLTVGHTTSGAELVAEWAEGAHVVKAFNSTGAGNMVDPIYDSQRAAMFICGDEETAKSAVAKLATDLGFEVVDVGSLSAARYLEPLAMLWITLAYVQGLGPDFAFTVVNR